MAISNTGHTAEELVLGAPAGMSKSWNWHPDIPIKTSPLFEFPPNPFAIIKWYAGAWLPVGEIGTNSQDINNIHALLSNFKRKQGEVK